VAELRASLLSCLKNEAIYAAKNLNDQTNNPDCWKAYLQDAINLPLPLMSGFHVEQTTESDFPVKKEDTEHPGTNNRPSIQEEETPIGGYLISSIQDRLPSAFTPPQERTGWNGLFFFKRNKKAKLASEFIVEMILLLLVLLVIIGFELINQTQEQDKVGAKTTQMTPTVTTTVTDQARFTVTRSQK
jgi:hypothetical protein